MRRLGLWLVFSLTMLLILMMDEDGGLVVGQFLEGSPLYARGKTKQQALLQESLKNSNPDVQTHFYPARAYFDPDYYIFSEPDPENYKIGLLVDPCKGNPNECCMNIYGTPEYYQVSIPDQTYPYRVDPKYVLGDEREILQNADLVDEFGSKLSSTVMRRADDTSQIDNTCVDVNVPSNYCTGFRKRQGPYPLKPACKDNNATVDATLDCWDPINKTMRHNCMQVAYMQTAFAVLCGNDFADDAHCGTYLEIHLPNGSPDYDVSYKIQERKILSRSTSGYTTTTIPLTYLANDSFISPGHERLLCDYQEERIRIGTSVLIKDTAPKCCCPKGYTWCPILGYDKGPFAQAPDTLAKKIQLDGSWNLAPFCPPLPSGEDWIMCQYYNAQYKREVYTKCASMNTTVGGGSLSSTWINSTNYQETCPYFDSCVLSYNNGSHSDLCDATEDPFTFIGRVGTVTYTPPPIEEDNGMYLVTFNNGRSHYAFAKKDLIVDNPSHNYEVWWVQRTRYNYIVQKKKPFRVKAPKCTYDAARQEYLPYAIRIDGGELLDTLYV